MVKKLMSFLFIKSQVRLCLLMTKEARNCCKNRTGLLLRSASKAQGLEHSFLVFLTIVASSNLPAAQIIGENKKLLKETHVLKNWLEWNMQSRNGIDLNCCSKFLVITFFKQLICEERERERERE